MDICLSKNKGVFFLIIIFLSLFLSGLNVGHAAANDKAFLHPGMLYTQADLERMKAGVDNKQDPWYTDWQLLQSHYLASATYSVTPKAVVYRNDPTNGSVGNGELQNSASAALSLAIEWAVTKNPAYANAAIKILNGWSTTLTAIKGNDAQLVASLYGYKLLNAAEILRYSGSGWSPTEIAQFSKMMTNVFYPLTKTYGQVNGGWANGNWDAADTVFNLSLGVWLNDFAIYDNAVTYFKQGGGNGSVIHYVQNENGQLQESGRDQAHAQGGLGLLVMAAQIGYNQRQYHTNGADMVSYPNNTYPLVKAAEYTAKYNLGYTVPYTPIPGKGYTLADMGKGHSWTPGLTISPRFRGEFRPIYRSILNLFTAAGVSETTLPYTKDVISRMPIGKFYFDHPSYEGVINAINTSASNTMYIALQSVSKALNKDNTGTLTAVTGASAPITVNGVNPSVNSGFQAIYLNQNRFAFRSIQTGKYISVSSDGRLLASADNVRDSESFIYTDSGNGNGTLLAVSNRRYVVMDSNTYQLSATGTSVNNDNGRWMMLYPDPTALGVVQ
ncbi:alginate lyase family protein [Pectobacterium punjabense]|uniref:alginate lyase family protein n=1 Tax=Pectobacterium punjabense TaxID=2108399 RepID=UPI001969727F|nr:alginate lyase family protein [Pectobacterium punjabense]MBN3135055.1 alginate lyase family protein [Pectobacterium punjabense]MCE5379273.1 alginate lyase family protein [Pectobacterium punjabense]